MVVTGFVVATVFVVVTGFVVAIVTGFVVAIGSVLVVASVSWDGRVIASRRFQKLFAR